MVEFLSHYYEERVDEVFKKFNDTQRYIRRSQLRKKLVGLYREVN